MIKYPLPIDKTNFIKEDSEITESDVKYGLPKVVEYCSMCVESNQRPSTTIEFKNKPGGKKEAIAFNAEGVCSACEFAKLKKSTDWDERDSQLRELCDKHRRNDGKYDCIVPGSGGKDSILVAHELKNTYGMNPLTVTWAPNIYTSWGRKNHDAWIHSGQDNLLWTPNGKTHRLLTRLAVDVLYHPFQPFILGQKSLAPRIASSMGIKLVFYGEHEAEYGSPLNKTKGDKQEASFSDNTKDEIFISGVNINTLIENFGIKKSELQPYLPLSSTTASNVEVHYFGYYRKWHPQGAYYYAVEKAGFSSFS